MGFVVAFLQNGHGSGKGGRSGLWKVPSPPVMSHHIGRLIGASHEAFPNRYKGPFRVFTPPCALSPHVYPLPYTVRS